MRPIIFVIFVQWIIFAEVHEDRIEFCEKYNELIQAKIKSIPNELS
jgi:hypothetical protein